MPLRSALLLFLAMLIPVARADEQREQAKQKLAQELLKALLEDDDDDEEDKPKKAKPAPKKEKAGKTFEPAADAVFSAEAHTLTPGAIYPSLILATATIKDDGTPNDPTDATHYGDPMATLGVLLRNVRKDDKITVEVSADAIIKPSKVSFTAKASEVLVTAAPKVKFDFEALGRVTQTRPINVTFKVTRNGKAEDDIDEVMSLRQINDCPFTVSSPTPKKNGKTPEEEHNIMFMFAAYANENHPQIDQILKEAKATGLCNSFLGYQGTEQDVIQQVNSIWVALQRRGITYSSITDTPPVKGVDAQHVRFLDESINMTQANCVDGSVLMASVLKKIGIKTALVLVPGHCYLAFYSHEPDKGGKLYGVETVMLGDKKPLNEVINYATFQSEDSLQKKAAQFSREGSGYMLVDLDEARESGIMPIPYVKGLK
ncbi:MAG: hypothetical protein RL444_508 [Verrucomicrobiota bacterium]|jgi:hypothetical protein